jgi:diguanylate cyclase
MLPGLAQQDDWRRKYYDSLKAVEQEGRQRRAQLQVLYRLVGRLCLAAQGQSAHLDEHLGRLRDAVRRMVPFEELEPLGEAVADAVKNLDVRAASVPAARGEPAAAVLPGEQVRHNLAATMPCGGPDQPPHRSSAGPSQPADETAAAAGDAPLEPSTRAVLSMLLAELGREPQYAAAANALDAELAGPMSPARKLAVIEQVATLVMQRINELEKSRRELELLMNQMIGQLDALTHYLSGQSADETERTNSTTTLNLQITGEVRAIGESMESSADLEQIREQLRTRLAAIGQHLHMFRLREEERSRQARERTESLRRRMNELEAEARQLQTRLSTEKRLSLLDPLTRIGNRMAWDQRYAAEFDRWLRFRQPTCVLAWDIDHFKSINDSYGHRAGDKVLAVVAETLAKGIRSTDFVARYGGEEFVMLLPGTGLESGVRLANRIREAVAQIGFHFRGQPVPVTISCGITELRDGDSDDEAFDRADRAMYRAKEGGRNRVVAD